MENESEIRSSMSMPSPFTSRRLPVQLFPASESKHIPCQRLLQRNAAEAIACFQV